MDPDLPPAQATLALHIRYLVTLTGLALSACAGMLSTSDSTLSRWMQGERRPTARDLKNLRALAIRRVEENDLPASDVPSADYFTGVLQEAEHEDLRRRYNKLTCDIAFPGSPPTYPISDVTGPADDRPDLVPAVVPVPGAAGDRHNESPADEPAAHLHLLWPPAAALAEYLADGDLERANVLIRHAGLEASAEEAALAVAACRDLGLPEAADTIARYAGTRTEREVLEILNELAGHGRCTDVAALLRYALRVGIN